MDKKAVNRALKVLKARFADFIALIKDNKKLASIIAAAVLIVAAVMGIVCASCSASKKKAEDTTNDNPPVVATTDDRADHIAEPAANGQGKYKVTLDSSDTLNLRLIPSSTSADTKIVTTIPNGTELNVQFVYNGWGFVEYGDYSGWVSMQFLTPAA